MKRLIVYLLIAVLLFVTYSIFTPINQKELWEIIQRYRMDIGKPVFIEDPRLCALADERVQEIKIEFKHRLTESKYNTEYSKSEILLGCEFYCNSFIALDTWLNSPPHKSAIDGDWKYSCLRCSSGYCVQIFSSFDNADHSAKL